MKSLFKYILTAAAVLAFISSCQMKEDDIFDLDPATREDNWMAEYRRVFNNNEYGWALYSNNPTYGHHPHPSTYAVKFDSIWANFYYVTNNNLPGVNVGDTLRSLYSFKMDDGIVLSFDTYNKWFHNGADQSQYFSKDLQGDFEFCLDRYSENEDTIFGRGKTKQLPFLMIKMHMPAADYQAAADQMNAYEPYNCVFICAGDTLQARFLSGYHNLSLYYPDEGATEATEHDYSYCNLVNGVYMLENIVYKGVTVKELRMNPDGDGFTDINGNAKIGPKPFYDYFAGDFEDDGTFTGYSQLGSYTKGEWDKMRKALTASGKYNPDDLAYCLLEPNGDGSLALMFNKWYGSGEIYFYCDVKKISNDEIAVRYTGKEKSGLGFNCYDAGFKYAVDAFAPRDGWRVYKISLAGGNPMSPDGFVWTDESNPQNSFTMPTNWHYYHYSVWE